MNAFLDEIEKIAALLNPAKEYSLRAGQAAVHRLRQNADQLGKQLGKKRYVPFTEEHRAYDAAVQRANRAERRFKAVTRKRLKNDLRMIQKKPDSAPGRGGFIESAQKVLRGKKLPGYMNRSQIKGRRQRLGIAAGGTALIGTGALLASSRKQEQGYGGY